MLWQMRGSPDSTAGARKPPGFQVGRSPHDPCRLGAPSPFDWASGLVLAAMTDSLGRPRVQYKHRLLAARPSLPARQSQRSPPAPRASLPANSSRRTSCQTAALHTLQHANPTFNCFPPSSLHGIVKVDGLAGQGGQVDQHHAAGGAEVGHRHQAHAAAALHLRHTRGKGGLPARKQHVG